MNLQALGDSSDSECCDSSLNDSNGEKIDKVQNGNEESNEDIDVDSEVLEEEPAKKKEILYEKYKDGLKLLSVQEFNQAEALFESLLKNPLLELVNSLFLDKISYKSTVK